MDLLDIPKLYTAVAEVSACLMYSLLLPRRHSKKVIAAIFAAAYILFGIFHWLSSYIDNNILWLLYMATAFTSMYVLVWITADETWHAKLYVAVRAFVLAEFVASLHWQIYFWLYTLIYAELPLVTSIVSHVSMVVMYAFIFWGYYMLERQHYPRTSRLGITPQELSSSVIAAVSAFIMSNLSFAVTNTPFSGISTSIFYIRTLADLAGLLVLYSQQEHHNELSMRTENMAMNSIIEHQYSQYQLSLENTEQLKREFHDLKHYMIAIRSETDPQKKEQYLQDLEHAIDIQESLSNTGSSVLDAILTAKQLSCLQNDITFTCMADGSLIGFMDVKDICSIFGNILDNAMEHVMRYDPEKRVISLSVTQKNEFVLIECVNYSDVTLDLDENSMPVTTKKDKEIHGYGLKSIRLAAGKYGGNMTIQNKDELFSIRLLIPVQ